MPIELRDDELADAQKFREEAGLAGRSLFTPAEGSRPLPAPAELLPGVTPEDVRKTHERCVAELEEAEPVEKARRGIAHDGTEVVEDDDGLLRWYDPDSDLSGIGLEALREGR